MDGFHRRFGNINRTLRYASSRSRVALRDAKKCACCTKAFGWGWCPHSPRKAGRRQKCQRMLLTSSNASQMFYKDCCDVRFDVREKELT